MPVHNLTFQAHARGRSESRTIPVRAAVIAGWTGRDAVARDKHIAELEAIGIARPATTPIYYRVSASRLTTADEIEVPGTTSSGEAEFILVRDAAGLWVGVGSDHTDRKVETYNVTISKQMCDKPIASELWSFEDVRDHWDKLVLRSWIEEAGSQQLYQEGTVANMLPPDTIIAGFAKDQLAEGTLMYCGTLAAKGGIRPSNRFTYELSDPVRNRRITSTYSVVTLPIMG